MATPGDCLITSGNGQDLDFTGCGDGSLRVVAVIYQHVTSAAEADQACRRSGVPYTSYYYSDWADRPDVPDIVLCLRSGA